MNRLPLFNLRLGACVSLLLIVAGCAVGPDYRAPKTSIAGNDTNASYLPPSADASWWHSFQDPQLEGFITRATRNNRDLHVAQARLREARALWTEARFDYAPTVRNENRAERSQGTFSSGGDRRPDRRNTLYRAGFDATWELDLWGAVRRNVEAARATVESVEGTRDDVLVSVRAEVAGNYFELRGLQAQLAVATRNATNQEQTLRLAEALRDGGQGTQFDVARARSLLNATLASVPPIHGNIDRAAHRIAVLCGETPTALREELRSPAPLPRLPSNIGSSEPADLLRRRPDVRAAERSLAAATARIGVEVADLFPRVTFNGSVGLQASTLSGLTQPGADTFSFGPRLSWAAFDLGRVRQRIKAAEARSEGSLATYEQTVLLALEEAANSLAIFQAEQARVHYLIESERAALEATELARQRYRDGISDFLSVLDAERTLLDVQEQVVTSQTRAATSLVTVYKSFAGGF